MKKIKPITEAIGVDIGTHSIKLVQLKQNAIVKLGMVEIAPNNPLTNLPAEERDKAVSSALKKILSENSINIKKAITSVAGDAVLVRYIILPKMTQDELKATIKFEAEPHISFPIDQAILDFQILGDNLEEEAKRMDVLLVAAKKEIVERQISVMKDGGLRPVLIDVDAFALENLYEYNWGQEQPSGSVALLDIGATYTNINIVENGVSRFTRDVSIAGDTFTKYISRDLKIDYQQAEELKKTKGIILADDEEEYAVDDKQVIQISDIIKAAFHELLGEVRRSFDYYQAQRSERVIKKIILSGGSSKLKNITKFISQETKITVELSDPFVKLQVNPKIYNTEYLEQIAPFFSVSMGLALRTI